MKFIETCNEHYVLVHRICLLVIIKINKSALLYSRAYCSLVLIINRGKILGIHSPADQPAPIITKLFRSFPFRAEISDANFMHSLVSL